MAGREIFDMTSVFIFSGPLFLLRYILLFFRLITCYFSVTLVTSIFLEPTGEYFAVHYSYYLQNATFFLCASTARKHY